MKTYHKIQSIYKRNPATKYKTFLDGDWSVPVFGLLKDIEWTFTEKINGTNIRIGWDGLDTIELAGRSNNADIPAPLTNYMHEHFTTERMLDGLAGPVTLMGEGYGDKIQKGSGYQQKQRFILFDVFIEPTEDNPVGIWLERGVVDHIAGMLEIPVVPIIHQGPLLDGIDIVEGKPTSIVSTDKTLVSEGVVARPSTELRDRMGHRIITKIKVKDFERRK